MAVVTYQGTVENGQVRLTPGVRIPDKTEVYVVIPEGKTLGAAQQFDLAEMLSRMPADYAPQEEDWGEPVGMGATTCLVCTSYEGADNALR